MELHPSPGVPKVPDSEGDALRRRAVMARHDAAHRERVLAPMSSLEVLEKTLEGMRTQAAQRAQVRAASGRRAPGTGAHGGGGGAATAAVKASSEALALAGEEVRGIRAVLQSVPARVIDLAAMHEELRALVSSVAAEIRGEVTRMTDEVHVCIQMHVLARARKAGQRGAARAGAARGVQTDDAPAAPAAAAPRPQEDFSHDVQQNLWEVDALEVELARLRSAIRKALALEAAADVRRRRRTMLAARFWASGRDRGRGKSPRAATFEAEAQTARGDEVVATAGTAGAVDEPLPSSPQPAAVHGERRGPPGKGGGRSPMSLAVGVVLGFALGPALRSLLSRGRPRKG